MKTLAAADLPSLPLCLCCPHLGRQYPPVWSRPPRTGPSHHERTSDPPIEERRGHQTHTSPWVKPSVVCPMLSETVKYLAPLQVGVGVPNGTEYIVNGLNRVLSHPWALSQDSTITLVDFDNAFNRVNRLVFAEATRSLFPPSLAAWIHFSYGCLLTLFVGCGTIFAALAGVQQGDPLRPFFFALAPPP